MSLRDNAIVAYAETKVMEKSDRNVWVLEPDGTTAQLQELRAPISAGGNEAAD